MFEPFILTGNLLTCDCNGNYFDDCGSCGGEGTDLDNDNICDDGVYEPVCGYNGATFPNSCYAENSGITIYTEGECE